MAVDDAAPRAPRQGPVALADLFDSALKDLAPKPRPPASAPAPASATSPVSATGDGFLFSGNRHESVPRRLFLDRRLTPLERNAWQVFRMMLNEDGVTAFPTYEQLRPWLASMPCAGQASHETVARALTLLRLTRWLSLVRRRRDPKTGRILGNLYVLHDEPLTPSRRCSSTRTTWARQPGPGPFGQGRSGRGLAHPQGDRRRPVALRPHVALAAAGPCRTPRQPGHWVAGELSTGG